MAIHSHHCSLPQVPSPLSLVAHESLAQNEYSSPSNASQTCPSPPPPSSQHLQSLYRKCENEKTFRYHNNHIQRCRIKDCNRNNMRTDGKQIAFPTVLRDHDKIHPIHITIIIIHTIIYTLKHLLNLSRLSRHSASTSHAIVASFPLDYRIHRPLVHLSHLSCRIHSDYNNFCVIINTIMQTIHLSHLTCAMGTFIAYNASAMMRSCAIIRLYPYKTFITMRCISRDHMTLSTVLLLNVHRISLLDGRVATALASVTCLPLFHLTLSAIAILILYTLHASTSSSTSARIKVDSRADEKLLTNALYATINSVKLNIFIALCKAQIVLNFVKKFTYSKRQVICHSQNDTRGSRKSSRMMNKVSSDKFTFFINVTSILIITLSVSKVNGEDDLRGRGIVDPRVITYPGDLNFALFIDGHESIDRKMVKRNGRSFVDTVNDIRSLPTPSTGSSPSPSSSTSSSSPMECSGKINSDGVLKAMSAIWAAHQVNIRRSRSKSSDTIKIGVSLFDSCSSPIVIQRQSVRMISSSLFSPSPSPSNGKLCQASTGKAVQPIIFGALVDTDTETTSAPALSLLDSFSIPVITTSHIYSDVSTVNSSADRSIGGKSKTPGDSSSDYPSLPKLSSSSSVFSVAPSLQSMAKGVISLLNRLSWSSATLVISDQIPNYYTDVFERIASKVHFNVIASSSSTNNRMRTVPIARRSDSENSSPGKQSKRSDPLHGSSHSEPVKNTLLFLSSKESLQLLTSLKSNLPLPDSDKFNWILVTDSDISDKVKQLFAHNATSSDKCVSKSMLLLVPNTNIPTREFNKYFEHEISTFGSSSVHPLVAKFSKQYLNSDQGNEINANSTANGKKKKKLLITSSEGLSLTIKSVWTLALALKQLEADQCTVHSLTKAACIEKLTSIGLRDLISDAIRRMSNESLDGLGISTMENDKLTFNQFNVLHSNRYSLKVITSSCKIFDSGYYSDDSGLRVNEVLFTTLNVDSSLETRDTPPLDNQHSPPINASSTSRNVNSAKGSTVISGSRLFVSPPVSTPSALFNHQNSLISPSKSAINSTAGESGSARSKDKASPSDENDDELTETPGAKSQSNVNNDDVDVDSGDDDEPFDDNLTRSLPLDINYSHTNSTDGTREKKRKRNSMSDNIGSGSSDFTRNNITRFSKESGAFTERGNYHHLHHTLSPISNIHRQRDIMNSSSKIVTTVNETPTSTLPSISSSTDHSVAMFAKLPSVSSSNSINSTVARQGRRGVANLPLNNVGSSSSNKNNVLTRNSIGNHGNTVSLNGQSSASTSLVSWLGRGWSLLILVTSIIGSLITLYTFTFLLMKSCEGALGHNYRQSLIAINLLSIMLLFLGSMLFIFEPSPILCTARRSAHNLSLCLLFGSLLIKSMYLRAYKTIGLGGQVNQINQFLTLLFIIAVQISIESHSWRALTDWSASPAAAVNLITSNSVHHLCSPIAKDYLNNQAYLLVVFVLLLLFTWISRDEPLTSNEGSNLFTSTALISPVFITSIVLCEYFVPLTSSDELPSSIVYLTSSRDAINSITMILIGYITLCTIFIPILYSIHTYGALINGNTSNSGGGGAATILGGPLGATYTDSSLSTAFTMFRGAKNIRHPHAHAHPLGHHGHNHRHNHPAEHANVLSGNVHSTDHRPILDNLSTSSGTSSTNHDYHINHSSPNRLLNVARMHAKQSENKKASKHSKSFTGQLTHHLFSSSSSLHGTKHEVHSHDDNAIHFSPCSNSYSYACNSPNCNFKLQPRAMPVTGGGGGGASGRPSPRSMHGRGNHLGLHLISTSSHAPAGSSVTCNPNGPSSPNAGASSTNPTAISSGTRGGSPSSRTSRFPAGLFRNEIPTFNRFISSTNKTRGVERDRGDHGTLITGVTYNRTNPLFENNSPNGMPNSSQIYRSAYP